MLGEPFVSSRGARIYDDANRVDRRGAITAETTTPSADYELNRFLGLILHTFHRVLSGESGACPKL